MVKMYKFKHSAQKLRHCSVTYIMPIHSLTTADLRATTEFHRCNGTPWSIRVSKEVLYRDPQGHYTYWIWVCLHWHVQGAHKLYMNFCENMIHHIENSENVLQ